MHLATVVIRLGIGVGDGDRSGTNGTGSFTLIFWLVVVPVTTRTNVIVRSNKHQFLDALLNEAPHIDIRQRIVVDIGISVDSPAQADRIAFCIAPEARIVVAEPVLVKAVL